MITNAYQESRCCCSRQKHDLFIQERRLLCSATGFLNKREKMPVGLNDNTIVVKYANKENHTKSGKK